MLVKSRGDVVLYDDFYKSNIDWKSLSENKKRELYTEFVLHYLPKELGDAAVGNPITFIIMIIVGAVIAKAGAVIAACAALIGASFSVLNIIEGCKLISKSAEGYDSIYDVNATKVSAKDLARGIALLGIEVIPVLLGLIKRGIAKYNNKEIKIGKKYTGGRTQEELNNFARAPAHKNTTNTNTDNTQKIKKPEKKNVQNKIWERVEKTAGNIQNTEVPTTFTTRLDNSINYVNPKTKTNVLWTNANATEHMGEYISRFGKTSDSIGIRSQVMLESYSAALNVAMNSLAEKSPGRYFGMYGNWELGINTETGIVYHARMIY